MSDFERYSRQSRLPVMGSEGQVKLAASHVAVIGCGALGSVAAELLARAGVGQMTLIDRDIVQWSNLQRQLLYSERDARQGRTKVEAAAARIRRINRDVQVTSRAIELNAANILSVLQGTDLWIDGTDHFEIRFLINDAALTLKKPWVHGGCVGTQGQVATFWPDHTLCFRCLVPQPPPVGSMDTCDTAGVLGPATTMIAALQTAQAIRLLVEGQKGIHANVMTIDPWFGRFLQIETRSLQAHGCPACKLGERRYLTQTSSAEPVQLCGQNAVQINPSPGSAILDLARIRSRLKHLPGVRLTAFFLRWEEGPIRGTLFSDGRAIIEGTSDPLRAKSIYQQLLGG